MNAYLDTFDRECLMAAIRSGLQPKYLMFWGHTSQHTGGVGKECLSQWYPASFAVDGQTFATAEHFMMAGKAQLFGDTETYERILVAPTPGAAKDLGRRVRGFDDERWKAICMEIVIRGNLEKFRQNVPLRDFLLGTNNRVLVEASPVDRIWGIGLAADDPRATHPELWEGPNLLGFALMAARQQLT
jgi:ribA/ribD-fused uncharacterized protein